MLFLTTQVISVPISYELSPPFAYEEFITETIQ